MKEIYDSARYEFYTKYNVYARTIFRKKLKSFSITQYITFILGKFSE
jgi:hypothetical protein